VYLATPRDTLRNRGAGQASSLLTRTPTQVLREIAPRVASLHALQLLSGELCFDRYDDEARDSHGETVVVWYFLEKMLAQIEAAPAALPPHVTAAQIRSEVEGMRLRFEAIELPTVFAHGDLKPSNVMRCAPASGDGGESASGSGGRVTFIDLELAGRNYRGYDLFKLFRTSGAASLPARAAFLRHYLQLTGASAELLDELVAEVEAFEPLSWLEAAVFFYFAMCTYPRHADSWAHLADDRWRRYLASVSAVEEHGEATRALLAARAARSRRDVPSR